MKPTANNSMTRVATKAPKGAAAPLPIEISSGVFTAITAKGAAVAMTMRISEGTPKVSFKPVL